MIPLVRVALIAMLAGPLGACLSRPDEVRVSGNPVNPGPVEPYRVECSTGPSALGFIAGDLLTACRPVEVPGAPPQG